MTERGHRLVDHTADVIVEAWAPTVDACLEEAVAGLVDVFTVERGPVVGRIALPRPGGGPPAMLAHLLDEIVFILDTEPTPPVAAIVTDGGVTVEVVEWVVGTGSAPKAISMSGLDMSETPDGWSARFIVDV